MKGPKPFSAKGQVSKKAKKRREKFSTVVLCTVMLVNEGGELTRKMAAVPSDTLVSGYAQQVNCLKRDLRGQ